MIVTHHPIMFGAVKRVTDETREGRLMLDMGLAGISHAAAHTNLDAAQGGVNDTLMRVMGAENVRGEGFVRVGDVPEGTTFRPALRAGAEEAARRRPRVRQRGNAGACAGLLPGARREIGEALALGADCSSPARCAPPPAPGAGQGMLHHRGGILKRKTRSAKCSPTLYKRRRMRYNIT